MAFSLNKLKNILNVKKDNQLAGSGSLDPEIGFKLSLHPVNKVLYVTVIGARHLPSLFGLSRAHGYLVKVTSSFVSITRYLPSIVYYISFIFLNRKDFLLDFGTKAYSNINIKNVITYLISSVPTGDKV